MHVNEFVEGTVSVTGICCCADVAMCFCWFILPVRDLQIYEALCHEYEQYDSRNYVKIAMLPRYSYELILQIYMYTWCYVICECWFVERNVDCKKR